MRNWVFALTTTVIFAGTVGVCVGLLLTQPEQQALVVVAIILAVIIPTYFGTIFNVWLGSRLNEDLIRRLGNRAPQSPAAVTSVPPAVPVQGSGRISESATVVQIPPPEIVRDHLRVQRFLREAPLPNENSRRNAQTWLRFLEITEPYLVAQLPPQASAQIDRTRSEVSKESFRQLRNEVAAFFSKNQMAWPITGLPEQRSGGSLSQTRQATRSAAMTPAKTERGWRVVDLPKKTWTIKGGGHAEYHSHYPGETLVIGFVRELAGQPFDFYIIDRRNYARFCEGEGFAPLFSARDRVAVDFEKWLDMGGVWYFVVDTYGKQNDRIVEFELRVGVPTVS